MFLQIPNGWLNHLQAEIQKEYFLDLDKFVEQEYRTQTIFPPYEQIFNAFKHCSFDDVRVVIIGQDPYHGENQANGLAFSINDQVRIPPSLRNIYKEIETDLEQGIPQTGNLEHWARQGVLLINATLTVRAHKAASHKNKGWEKFTTALIKKIADEKENVVFLLWGAHAQKKGNQIDKNKHCVLESVHPSPLSAFRGFFGSKHFSKTNDYLRNKNLPEIKW